jgi:2-keto-4-pentenoate hydratase/2-oxohepta-3-ene-1,7-dioic acid hydratase in catechol pathway
MKILCIGRNYAEHASELNNPLPEEPVVFMKPETALQSDQEPYIIPDFTQDLHYELEIVLRIGKKSKQLELDQAWDVVDGIGIGIDFTARDLQSKLKAKGLPWEKAKAFDGSAIVSNMQAPSEFDKDHIRFHLLKNGVEVQTGLSSDMLFSIPKLLQHLGRYFTLMPGDMVFTGTPAGVGRVEGGDVLEGFLEGKRGIQLAIVNG